MAPASSALLAQRMVARELLELVVAQPVAARVADVAHHHAVRPEGGQDQRGPHALQVGIGQAAVEDGGIGLVGRGLQRAATTRAGACGPACTYQRRKFACTSDTAIALATSPPL